MNLTTRIESDYLAAMRARDELVVSVLRMLKAAAKMRQVELRRPLTDDELLDVLAKQGKQRRESIELFAKANRADLVEKEERELGVLMAYLPAPLTDAELGDAVAATVAELDARGMKDMGRVVQAVLAAHKGRVDGKRASDAVKAHLASS
ncbi:GatB/YqeY domain protein [Solidesulfovibrio carbinoliphilus subsp. oakridgensis]|uniref:GatB/YqeY domain protein n=1 Tax=Solidesulfovibrio carbinoliphilus subsp. oakridgensis TaxID=694327 RepID=G7Q470_9BACT|nr:GatB/YqeY domain-containing protein [Solidesulfovibrio carbinoliphilus]EHJ46938.1 GatB/YqeY domain protein [Solidesulfovibrio carbinoliphilus subsp. oakridgensis]